MTPHAPGEPKNRPVVLVVENDATCPPALVGRWLSDQGLDLRLLRAHAGEAVPPKVPDDVDAVLSLGGVVGANDDDRAPWLADERVLLADAARSGTPVLGLCLGGQLLAAATGGSVAVSERSEIGVSEVTRTLDGLADPVIGRTVATSGDTVPAAQWHFDRITGLPGGAVVLMSNDACPVQAFRLGETAYGLQMHPEVDAKVIDDWAKTSPEHVPATSTTASQAQQQFLEREQELTRAWQPAIEAWAQLVWRRSRTLGTVMGS